MSIVSEKVIEIINDICSDKIKGEGGATYDFMKQMQVNPNEIAKLDERLEEMKGILLSDDPDLTKEERIERRNSFMQEIVNILEKKAQLLGFIGYKYTYDVIVPIWQSTIDYFKVIMSGIDYHNELKDKTDEIVKIIEFINDSQEEIINALKRDNSEGLKEFRPSKVSSVLFDYSGEKPEFSFYVESNEEYHYHIYIKDDMTFDAGYIS